LVDRAHYHREPVSTFDAFGIWKKATFFIRICDNETKRADRNRVFFWLSLPGRERVMSARFRPVDLIDLHPYILAVLRTMLSLDGVVNF